MHQRSHICVPWNLWIIFCMLFISISTTSCIGSGVCARNIFQIKFTLTLPHIKFDPRTIMISLIFLIVLVQTRSPFPHSPRSRVQLKSAVDTCVKVSPKGKCFASPHGPIGTWDVSREMFDRAKFFSIDVAFAVS